MSASSSTGEAARGHQRPLAPGERMRRELARVGARVGDRAARELLLGQHARPRAHVRRAGAGTSAVRERPDVDAVDRGHRRDVAGAEALERAHVDVGSVARRPPRIAAYSSSAPRSEQEMFVHTYTLWRPTGRRLEHVVEARHRLQVGGRQAHHAGDLLDRLGRAPAVQRAGRRRARAAPPSGGRGSGPCAPRSPRAAPPAPRRARGSGISAGSFSRSAAPSQPGTREPCSKRLTALIGRCPRGSGRASPAWRSGRRCRRP